MSDLISRINNYLQSGGFFNPEMMEHEKVRDLLMDIRTHLQGTECGCHKCRPITQFDMRMILCPDCGNKRCPKATDHDNACTNSNEPGQEGSCY